MKRPEIKNQPARITLTVKVSKREREQLYARLAKTNAEARRAGSGPMTFSSYLRGVLIQHLAKS
jgi:hypothetical protein